MSDPGVAPDKAFGESRSRYHVPAELRVNVAKPTEQAWLKLAEPSAVTVATPVLGSIAVICAGRPFRAYTVVVVPLRLQTLNWVGPVAGSATWSGERRGRMGWPCLSPA